MHNDDHDDVTFGSTLTFAEKEHDNVNDINQSAHERQYHSNGKCYDNTKRCYILKVLVPIHSLIPKLFSNMEILVPKVES